MLSSYTPRTTLNSLCTTLSTDKQPLPTPDQMSSAQSGTSSQPDVTNISNLVKAINAIVKSNLPSKVQLCEPNPFDGSDTKKLHTFLSQCKLNFRDRKDLFCDDSVKVNYILSYLKGPAPHCFEPGLLKLNEPMWLSDYNLFISELEANFGTYDPIAKAEAELEGLCMQENHQATKYFVKFMQLASHVQWGEATLLRRAYHGLAKRIKDNQVHHDKPTSILALHKLALSIDSRYWERRAEEAHTTSGHSGHSGTSKSKGKTSEPKKSTPDLST